MPTVTILSPTKVVPEVVRLMRNDQTIMWELGPGLSWGSIAPIQLMPGGGSSPTGVPYSDWPVSASMPRPIDNGNPPDRRPFWTSANLPMPGDEYQWYRYEILVQTFDEKGVATIHRLQLQREKDGGWYDPDVLNDPRP